jgi:uncharacterized protein
MAAVPQPTMIDMVLSRIVIRDQDRVQYLYLRERAGQRGFPMVIARPEADEIQRVVSQTESPRPLTHQLAHSIVAALGAKVRRADIVDLRDNTFFAQLVLQTPDGVTTAVLDARPSDAIALALRAGAPIRVAEFVLEQVRSDKDGPDPLPGPQTEEEEQGP